MGPQLPLSVQLADHASFDNFHAGPNEAALSAMRALGSGALPALLLIHGPAGSGKSHLLQSVVRERSRGGSAVYLPLDRRELATADALNGLDTVDLLALDGVDLVIGDPSWALACLRLLDARRTLGLASVVSMSIPPERLPPEILKDLVTRLDAMARYPLKPLDDEELRQLLQSRARRRGLELSTEVAEFLLRRLPRRVPDLMDALETLDRAALSAQRRLTIPFVQHALPALAPTTARTAPG